MRFILKILFILFIFLSISFGFRFLIHSYIIAPFYISQNDMEPSFSQGDTIYIWRYFSHDELKRGSLVLVSHPKRGGSKYKYIRRLIAFPGETVFISERKIYIQKDGKNKEVLNTAWEKRVQKYHYPIPVSKIKPGHRDFLSPVTVPEGKVFLLADNRIQAIDSRLLENFPYDSIIGLVLQ